MTGKTIYPDKFIQLVKETFGKYSDEGLAADEGLIILGSMLNKYIGETISPQDVVKAFEDKKIDIFADYKLYSKAKQLDLYSQVYDEWLTIYDGLNEDTVIAKSSILEEILA
jgi:hypothetical protein